MTLEERRVPVALTAYNLKLALELAGQRNGKERRYGAMTYGGKQSGLGAHTVGILAEMAVAQHYGVQVDQTIYQTHGDNGIDLQNVAQYGRVGVKCTTYTRQPLLRVEKEHFSQEIDTYVLCCLDEKQPSVVYLVGSASKEHVAQAPVKRLLQSGPLNYLLSEADLSPMQPHLWDPWLH
jgi:hypothetical protein